jgi:predicted aminopeptidase
MRFLRSKLRPVALAVLISIQLGGCGLGYYWQATSGHLGLMGQRRPVSEVVADPDTPAEVRDRLEIASRAVDFAHEDLLLPDNGSYESYVDTGERYVVWNVFAAPEFSLDARTWCFPVAGCVSYRGYFDEIAARDFAAGLSARGDDTWVGGVAAYSTLGRFADPLLNTMMALPDYRVAGLIFHELAHQRLYVKGDSKFNEGFASFVEQEGVRRWLAAADDDETLREYRLMLDRLAQVHVLLAKSRQDLDALYARELADEPRRAAKQQVLAGLRSDYADLRESWDGPPDFDHWFQTPFNNARLTATATYDDYVPAFRALLNRQDGDLEAFYAKAGALAGLSADERSARMAALLERLD